jgi:hypothetical protein
MLNSVHKAQAKGRASQKKLKSGIAAVVAVR